MSQEKDHSGQSLGFQGAGQVFKEGWTLKPFVLSKSFNLGTTNLNIIDLPHKICVCDVITVFIYLHCDIIEAPSVQTWFVHFFVSVQP